MLCASHTSLKVFLFWCSAEEVQCITINATPMPMLFQGQRVKIDRQQLLESPPCSSFADRAVVLTQYRQAAPHGTPVDMQHAHRLAELRHPNILPLLAVCPELHAVMYDFMPVGVSLNISSRRRRCFWISVMCDMYCTRCTFCANCYANHGDGS